MMFHHIIGEVIIVAKNWALGLKLISALTGCEGLGQVTSLCVNSESVKWGWSTAARIE